MPGVDATPVTGSTVLRIAGEVDVGDPETV
jgi:hypothetical protein